MFTSINTRIIKMAEISAILLQIYSLRHFILHKHVARNEHHCYIPLHRILHLGNYRIFLPIDYSHNGVTYTLVSDA
jgi:hypothetical protein